MNVYAVNVRKEQTDYIYNATIVMCAVLHDPE